MIALRMVLDAPERIERLVLMGSGGAPIAPTPDLMRMVGFYTEPTEAAMRDLLPRFVHDPTLFAGRLDEIAAARFPARHVPRSAAHTCRHSIPRGNPFATHPRSSPRSATRCS